MNLETGQLLKHTYTENVKVETQSERNYVITSAAIQRLHKCTKILRLRPVHDENESAIHVTNFIDKLSVI